MPDKIRDGRTLHIESHFAGTDVFMSLHKPIGTLFLTPNNSFYEFTNSFHAKYKPIISSKCWLGRTDGHSCDYMLPPLRSIKMTTHSHLSNCWLTNQDTKQLKEVWLWSPFLVWEVLYCTISNKQWVTLRCCFFYYVNARPY